MAPSSASVPSFKGTCTSSATGRQVAKQHMTNQLPKCQNLTLLKANYLFNAMLCRPQTAGGEFLSLTIIYSSVACLLSLPIVQALTLFSFIVFFWAVNGGLKLPSPSHLAETILIREEEQAVTWYHGKHCCNSLSSVTLRFIHQTITMYYVVCYMQLKQELNMQFLPFVIRTLAAVLSFPTHRGTHLHFFMYCKFLNPLQYILEGHLGEQSVRPVLITRHKQFEVRRFMPLPSEL